MTAGPLLQKSAAHPSKRSGQIRRLVHHLGFRPVAALAIFLMPLAALVLIADFLVITAHLLFGGDDAGCFDGIGIGRESFE